MRYAFFTFAGDCLPIAKRLVDEGNEVVVGVVSRPEKLKVDSLDGQKESPEKARRRLSNFDGLVDKVDADELVRRLKPDIGSWFVVTDHNSLYEYGEKLLAAGAIGFISNREDFARENDRAAGKKFVVSAYDMVEVPETEVLKRAEDGIALVSDSDDLWVLKSNGNVGTTIVPKTNDTRLNHMEIEGALRTDTKDYETGGYVLERRIRNHIEFVPQMAFWNGEPIYSIVDLECKTLCAGDVGPDVGGAIDLVVHTRLDDPINDVFFPPKVRALAKSRAGLFMFDIGILYDIDSDVYYFIEFCGNRWGYGCVFAELAMATEKNRNASQYFERIYAGKDPLRYHFGTTIGLYNIALDPDHAGLHKADIPLYWRRAAEDYFWPMEARKTESGCVNVGYSEKLAYASACGDSLSQCVDSAYRVVDGVSFREMAYRPKLDYLSKEYPTSLLRRFEFLNREHFSVPGYRKG